MIKDNKPFTNENGSVDYRLITDLDEKEQKIVFKWIDDNIMPRKTELTSKTSYKIKHILENDTGIYLTNNQFKDAMMHCGYKPVRPNELNWTFRISKKSKAFREF